MPRARSAASTTGSGGPAGSSLDIINHSSLYRRLRPRHLRPAKSADSRSLIRDRVRLRRERMDEKKINYLQEGWQIARPYWFSEERWVARGLLVAVIVLNLVQVWINVRLNSWRNDFYNSLQEYDEHAFFYQIGLFTLLAGGFVVIALYQVYLQQSLQIRWRRWMTDVYLHEWLAKKTY